MAPGSVDVQVGRDDDGTIRVVGPAAGPDFTRAVLDVAGAVLAWPVLGNPGPPTAEIHDAGRAQQWLWAVYGERTAAAVHACAAGGSAGARVTADRTALASGAARLGFGHWAARWWPASHLDGIPALEPDVLALELAALTHECQQLFDDDGDQPDDCVAELIGDHEVAIDTLIRWWHATPPSTDTARRLESVLRSVDDAADCAGLDGQALRRLRSSLAEPRPVGTGAEPVPLFVRHRDFALAAGEPLVAGGRVIARGSGTNDWRRYPPGFVDASETAVSWTARALGARRRIEVEVVAHPAAPVTRALLVAEVGVDAGRPSRVPLARRDDVWSGRADLDPSAGETRPRIEIGVLLPGFDPGPGPESGADREAIRALARRRLARAAQLSAHNTSPHEGASGPSTHNTSPHEGTSVPFLSEVAAATIDEDY
jgi:hypothetical protein